jgi:hypothetical protein
MEDMPQLPGATHRLERDLRQIFDARLHSLVAYGMRASEAADALAHETDSHHKVEPPLTHTMAIVEALGADDLRACATRVKSWHDAELATPLILASHEFERALDAFPLEFGAILADHVVISGRPPFESLSVNPADVRRACEVQARSHLLHLREGYLETRGNGDALAVLIVRSAEPFAALLQALSRLRGSATVDAGRIGADVEHSVGLPAGALADVVRLARVSEISAAEATRIFPAYLDAVERLVTFVDQWSPS